MPFIICKAVGEAVVYMQSNLQYTKDEAKAFRIMSESAAESMVENEPESWIEEI